jgi:hypothetical protein
MIPVVRAVLGFLLLVTGRKLYWLFVGGIGFVLGVQLASIAFSSESEIVLITIALIAGIIGIILAFYAQRFAVAIAGFISGGLILLNLSSLINLTFGLPDWLLFIMGGIVGILLVAWLFDWALVVLSALTGAYLIAGLLDVTGWLSFTAIALLFIIGVIVQTRGIHKI